MKRTLLSSSQLQQVVSLRDSGMSWVKIEHETAVARRIAKREYEEWYEKRSQRQMEEARKDVAAQEYRTHLDLLSHLATLLIDSLTIPKQVTGLQGAGEVLSRWLATDIYQEQPSFRAQLGGEDHAKRVTRMNELLFKSLRDHTESKVPWKALDEWKQARNNCLKEIANLRKEISQILGNIVSQKGESKEAKVRVDEGLAALERCVEGILIHVWLNDLMGSEGKITLFKGISRIREGTAWVEFHREASEETRITFEGEDHAKNLVLAKDIGQLSERTLENLRRGKEGLIEKIRHEIREMRKKAGDLEAALNPLVLRPVILNTRCDICPI